MSETREQIALRLYEQLLGPLRMAARDQGYALAVHGSLRRDIDLVAVPWTSEASSARELADCMYAATESTLGFAPVRLWSTQGDADFTLSGCPGVKPHGRLGWVWQVGGGVYIDLSVMPRGAQEKQ